VARKATPRPTHRSQPEPGVPRVPASRRISARREPEALFSRRRKRLIIVGNGMVSHRLCARLIEHHPDRFDITVFAEERLPAYDRVHLGDVLTGRDPRSLLLAGEEWYEQHDITLHLGDPVVGLDLARRLVRSAQGIQLEYDRLVLATGSVPVTPTIKIDDWRGVFVLRTADDVDRLRTTASGARSAVVVGGGLLGLETASTLREAGLDITVIERSKHLMQPHLEPNAAGMLRTLLEGRGIAIRTEVTASAVGQMGDHKYVLLPDGSALEAHLVVLATGARPRDNLGTWGLTTHEKGGFVVNDLLQTSDPHVYAVGECAVFAGRPYGTVAPGYVMAECLAQTLADREVRFRPPAPSVRLKIAGLPVSVAGQVEPDSAPTVVVTDGEHRTIRVKDGQLVAATAVGEWRDWERVEDAVRNKRPIPQWRLDRFVRGESLWPDEPSATGRPDEQLICTCNRVDYGTICTAVRMGCKTVPEIAARTGATTTCGACVPVIERIIKLDAPPLRPAKVSPAWPLLGAVALLAALAVAYGRTFLEHALPWHLPFWDHLLRSPRAQQTTGFSVLGLVVVALFLPLRRKLARLPGSLGLWRAVHASVGLAATAGLAAHTGLRLGVNANLYLSLAFLALVGAGAVTAFWPWGQRPPAAFARGARLLHLALFWPALALLGLHILAVYSF
jgi:nitrite reductase (NADH) large subunit